MKVESEWVLNGGINTCHVSYTHIGYIKISNEGHWRNKGPADAHRLQITFLYKLYLYWPTYNFKSQWRNIYIHTFCLLTHISFLSEVAISQDNGVILRVSLTFLIKVCLGLHILGKQFHHYWIIILFMMCQRLLTNLTSDRSKDFISKQSIYLYNEQKKVMSWVTSCNKLEIVWKQIFLWLVMSIQYFCSHKNEIMVRRF